MKLILLVRDDAVLDAATVSAPLIAKPVMQRKGSYSSYSASDSSSSDSHSSDSDSEASHKSSSNQSDQQQGTQDVETSVSRRSVLGLRTRPPKRRVCIQSSGSDNEASDRQSNDGSDYVVSQSEKSEDDLEEDSVSGSHSADSMYSDEYLPKKRTTTQRMKRKSTKVNSTSGRIVVTTMIWGIRYGILILTRMEFGDHPGLESFPVVIQQKMTLTVNMVAMGRITKGIIIIIDCSITMINYFCHS